MAESQNGWPVDRTGELQDRSRVAGVAFPNGVRRGDVATVLFYVARRFHAEVEPLREGWSWGWFVKNIEGSGSISNHASGTALDLNAPDHPIGRRGTFSATKERAIRRILAACDGVVRWGGDYRGRPDEMHFEINAGSAAVKALANRIRDEQDREIDMSAEFFESVDRAVTGDPKATAQDRLNRDRFARAIRFAEGLEADDQKTANLALGPAGVLARIEEQTAPAPQ